MGEIVEAEERKGELSHSTKKKEEYYSMPVVHENIAILNLCVVLHDFNSKNLGTHSI